jgi:hypothetical protein
MWLTAVQRFVHVVHTWRRWQGASNMTKMVKFSLLIQLVNLGMTFFLPYRDLATDEWPEGVLSQLDNEILKDAQASMQFAGRSIDDDDICPTCRESFFGNGPVVYRAGCGDPPGSARHYVHRECEEVWQRARRDSVCVLCRSTDRTLIDAPTSPPYFSSEHATRRDRRFAEINEHSQNNVVIRNFMPAYLYGWVTSPSPLARRLADLSVGTTGDPIPPGGPRATAPVRSVSVENAGNPALPPVAVPLS